MKMPKRIIDIELDGDYKGFKFKAHTSVPMWVFSYIQTGEWGLIQKALQMIVIEWNFCDEEGQPLPQPNEMVAARGPMNEPIMVPKRGDDGELVRDEKGQPVMTPFMTPGISFISSQLGMMMLGKVSERVAKVPAP